jgi:hypothetical protein
MKICFLKKPGPSRDIFVLRHRQHATAQLLQIGWSDRGPVNGSQHLKDTLPRREKRFIVPIYSDHVGIQDQLIEPFAKYFPVADLPSNNGPMDSISMKVSLTSKTMMEGVPIDFQFRMGI